MTSKSSLFTGVAAFAAIAMISGVAQAAPAKKHAAKAPAVSAADVEALKAQVAALQSKLEALSAAQAKTEEVAEQNEAAQAQIVTALGAQSTAMNTMPATVKTEVLGAIPKPKASWIDNTTVSGRVYFDFSDIQQKNNGTKVAPTGQGFDLKRAYFGVDHKFNDMFSANVTTDFQYSSVISATELYLKKAYLQAYISDALTIRVGAADLPWVPFVEDLYGYRYLEQTLIDRTKFGTSSDWGVHALGKLGPYVSYAVAVIDGAGYKAPLRSKPMDIEGRVSVKYNDITLAIGGYSGKLGKDTEGAVNVFHGASRLDAIAAYTHGPIRAGIEYFSAKNWNNVTTTAQDNSNGYSVFGSYQFLPEFSVFGKYEWVKPKTTTASTNKDAYFNVGLQYEPVKIVDLSLVYKRDKVDNGTLNTGNGLIGGTKDGTYDEVGMFGQFRW